MHGHSSEKIAKRKEERKYVRILPRPAEAYGQPLTISALQQAGSNKKIQGEWCRPTQVPETVFNTASTNIFLRIQDEPIPSKSEDNDSNELPLIKPIGTPADTPVYAVDPRYLHYFLQELPTILSIDYLFPNVLICILGMTMGNPALWHAVLALSSYLADTVAGRPTATTYLHLEKSLPLIQLAISTLTIDDSHIAAVFCLTYLSLASGEIASAGRHLDGLILMLEHRDSTQTGENPLVNAIRRMAVRFDNVRAATGRELAFPSHKLDTTISRREWLPKLLDPDKLDVIEWALAEFELEDLANQVLHLNQRARNMRASATHNPETDEHELLFRADVLLDQLRKWRLRPILKAAETEQNISELDTPINEPPPAFLNYPSLRITNFIYAKLIILYYRLLIIASFVIYPQIGPQPVERQEAAIALCQHYVAYKALRPRISSVVVLPVAFAGFVLGPIEHPQEYEWICKELTEIERTSGLTAAAMAANALRTIWQNPLMPFWEMWFEQTDS